MQLFRPLPRYPPPLKFATKIEKMKINVSARCQNLQNLLNCVSDTKSCLSQVESTLMPLSSGVRRLQDRTQHLTFNAKQRIKKTDSVLTAGRSPRESSRSTAWILLIAAVAHIIWVLYFLGDLQKHATFCLYTFAEKLLNYSDYDSLQEKRSLLTMRILSSTVLLSWKYGDNKRNLNCKLKELTIQYAMNCSVKWGVIFFQTREEAHK